ncbi:MULTISPECIES: hypothetical protein [unclassified Sphingomonas]|nr:MULTISPECIES: hypothetical protein [unclassified Sphingomonas]
MIALALATAAQDPSRPGGGGEYPTQDGLGWTSGVASALQERYPVTAQP